jgi:hypothetical protein
MMNSDDHDQIYTAVLICYDLAALDAADLAVFYSSVSAVVVVEPTRSDAYSAAVYHHDDNDFFAVHGVYTVGTAMAAGAVVVVVVYSVRLSGYRRATSQEPLQRTPTSFLVVVAVVVAVVVVVAAVLPISVSGWDYYHPLARQIRGRSNL